MEWPARILRWLSVVVLLAAIVGAVMVADGWWARLVVVVVGVAGAVFHWLATRHMERVEGIVSLVGAEAAALFLAIQAILAFHLYSQWPWWVLALIWLLALLVVTWSLAANAFRLEALQPMAAGDLQLRRSWFLSIEWLTVVVIALVLAITVYFLPVSFTTAAITITAGWALSAGGVLLWPAVGAVNRRWLGWMVVISGGAVAVAWITSPWL
ncbi:MAG: hypothetical protein V1707_00565 [bacterium]